jgi:hypothetical protein
VALLEVPEQGTVLACGRPTSDRRCSGHGNELLESSSREFEIVRLCEPSVEMRSSKVTRLVASVGPTSDDPNEIGVVIATDVGAHELALGIIDPGVLSTIRQVLSPELFVAAQKSESRKEPR